MKDLVVFMCKHAGEWMDSLIRQQPSISSLLDCFTVSEDYPNFLDKSDPRFKHLRCACESMSRELRKAGVGGEVKHAPVISAEEEDQLWK